MIWAYKLENILISGISLIKYLRALKKTDKTEIFNINYGISDGTITTDLQIMDMVINKSYNSNYNTK